MEKLCIGNDAIKHKNKSQTEGEPDFKHISFILTDKGISSDRQGEP